jgi:quercetin dioxygenase-like cupin family protein
MTTKAFNETIDVVPDAHSVSDLPKGTLASGGNLKVVRLTVPAGDKIAEHKAGGDISVICLAGHVDFKVGDKVHHLEPNHLVCLSAGTLHSVEAVKDSVLLVNVCGS